MSGMAARAAATCSAVTVALAPGMTMMRLAPLASTSITAVPASPSTRAMWESSMPSSPTTPQQERPGAVGAHGTDHRHGGTEPRGGDGLVESLAAGVALEGRAEHRLARVGHPLEVDHEVLIEAADDDHAFTHVVDTLRCAGELVSTLGIDLGTGSVKAAVVDPDGTIRAEGQQGLRRRVAEARLGRDRPGVVAGGDARGRRAGHRRPRRREAVGFSGQMHGVVVTDADLRPLRPAILWADGRVDGAGPGTGARPLPGRAQPPRLAGGHRLRRDHPRVAARERARRDGASGARAAAEGLAARTPRRGHRHRSERCLRHPAVRRRRRRLVRPGDGVGGRRSRAAAAGARLGRPDRQHPGRRRRPAERGRRRRHGLRPRRARAAARRRVRRGRQRLPGRARHGRSAARRHPAHPHLRHRSAPRAPAGTASGPCRARACR